MASRVKLFVDSSFFVPRGFANACSGRHERVQSPAPPAETMGKSSCLGIPYFCFTVRISAKYGKDTANASATKLQLFPVSADYNVELDVL